MVCNAGARPLCPVAKVYERVKNIEVGLGLEICLGWNSRMWRALNAVDVNSGCENTHLRVSIAT